MKVKYIGEDMPLVLYKNKVYESLGIEGNFIRVIDESDEDYLFAIDEFEIIQGSTD